MQEFALLKLTRKKIYCYLQLIYKPSVPYNRQNSYKKVLHVGITACLFLVGDEIHIRNPGKVSFFSACKSCHTSYDKVYMSRAQVY